MAAIHQFIAGFTKGDAISNEALVLRAIFRSWGFDSDLFSELRRIPPELRADAHDVSAYRSRVQPDDVVVLHLSIGSVVNDIFASLPCRKAIIYHNVTPSHFFAPVQKQIARTLAKGRQQVKSLARTASVNMADSRFNAAELSDMGYADVKILPIIMNFDNLSRAADRNVLKEFRDGPTNILFVGRCAPNKKLEDLLVTFALFQQAVQPDSRFIHVGSFAGLERYHHVMLSMARDLKLRNVHFAGSVPQAQLNAFYQCADIFLSMSEHEGFCIPIIESMFSGLPVMAYAAGAVPDTMDGAGILFHEKKFDLLAEMMGRLARENSFRSAVIEGQKNRVERFRAQDPEARLREHMSPLLGHNGNLTG